MCTWLENETSLMSRLSCQLLTTVTGITLNSKLGNSGLKCRQKWPRISLLPFCHFKMAWILIFSYDEVIRRWDCTGIHPHGRKPDTPVFRWGLQKWNQSLLRIFITTPHYGLLDNKLQRKLPKGTCKIRYNTIMVYPPKSIWLCKFSQILTPF